MTEAIHAEVATFNIRVLLVEPGTIATDMTDSSGAGILLPRNELYKDTIVQRTLEMATPTNAATYGMDPNELGRTIVEAADGTGFYQGRKLGMRLPLGRNISDLLEQRARLLEDLIADTREVNATL
jgi:NAD(P)-dependent dehydrogenase (short-subunit alcohol dehydrogenase family)